MWPRLLITLLALLATTTTVRADKATCADHPLFPVHMPNYVIADCKAADFEAYDFYLPRGLKHREEGKFTYLNYKLETGKPEASGIEVVRNFENAIKKLGGTINASDPARWVNGKLVVDGKEIWFQAEKGNGRIWLRIVEKTAMVQHIVADAAAFSADLAATGHVAVEGIFFDTNKAILKPESTPALEQVAKLLKADPELKLWVVGHTDAVGKLEDNMKLAQARAEAVATALTTTHGIPAGRLKGYGSGPLAPVATNDTDEGRARNRRVELVKQP
ncbi:MAG: OmpA family protein [Proteobacteria bacterium]|nr:OmpA family protein [Pseudomonadota bacterium]